MSHTEWFDLIVEIVRAICVIVLVVLIGMQSRMIADLRRRLLDTQLYALSTRPSQSVTRLLSVERTRSELSSEDAVGYDWEGRLTRHITMAREAEWHRGEMERSQTDRTDKKR